MHYDSNTPKESNREETKYVAVVFVQKETHDSNVPGQVFVKLGLWTFLFAFVPLKLAPLLFIDWPPVKKIGLLAVTIFIA